MVADFGRESGVLVLVFTPLYVFFEGSKASRSVIAITLAIGLLALLFGIVVERSRS